MSMGESKAATVMRLAVEGEAVWNLSLVQLVKGENRSNQIWLRGYHQSIIPIFIPHPIDKERERERD